MEPTSSLPASPEKSVFPNLKTKNIRRIALQFGLLLLLILSATLKLETIPQPWWDEGWTLNVARNWVTLGQYGQLLEGQPRGPGLSAAFPVVAPVALSFKLFGIGVWQGRLPSVLYLFASLALIFYLADRLYQREIAYGSLFVLIFMSGIENLNPLVLGRTVMGEMPGMFYLLAGYALFRLALKRSAWLVLPAALSWGIALQTKAQIPPFWAVSLILPLLISLIKRWWRPALLLASGLAAAWLFSRGMGSLQSWVLGNAWIPSEPVQGLVQVSAMVLRGWTRLSALILALTLGLPTLLGLGYAALKALEALRKPDPAEPEEMTRLLLLSFAGSWLGWFVSLSAGMGRYLFPAVFVGSIFTAALLHRLTFQFDIRETIRNANAVFSRRRNRAAWGAFLAMLITVFSVTATVKYLLFMYTQPNPSISEVASYLNNSTPPGALIESYESELYFLLARRYHYPPDDISAQIIAHEILLQDISYDYDPLSADPDYLVVGAFARWAHLYDSVLSSGDFKLLKSFPGVEPYEVYARVRR